MNKLIVLVLVLFLSGCKQVRKNASRLGRKQYDELIARISSIPDTPFFAQVEHFSEDAASMYNLIIRYRYHEDVEVVRSFYVQEMERDGWNLVMQVDAQDKVLTFDKPGLVAVIEICPKEQNYSVALGHKLKGR